MLSVVILVLLAWHFYIGYNRGIILQLFYSIGAVLSFVLASQWYQFLADKLTLWVPYSNPAEGVSTLFFTDVNIFKLSVVYYAGIGFFVLFLLVYTMVRLLGVLVHIFPIDHFDQPSTKLISGFLGMIVSLVFLAMTLTILATVPMPFVQNQLHASALSRLIINHTPILSDALRQLWVTVA